MYIDERHFVKTAIQKMNFLEAKWAVEQVDDQAGRASQSFDALEAIKTTAVSVQARGVYRAAILCEDVLSRLTPDNITKMGPALIELKRLVYLYADGLFEIDPEFAEIVLQPEGMVEPDVNLSSAHQKAVQTLSPLVSTVESENLRNALKSLMKPVQIGSTERSDRKTMSLDTLIQPISNMVLSEARHCGKIVTVSYAADFADLAFDVAENVQDILEAVCLKIVAQGIVKSTSVGLGPTPQISLTGQYRAGNILFSISWIGRDIEGERDLNSNFAHQMRKLEKGGGSYSFNKLALSEAEKSRHTLYVKLPLVDSAGLNQMLPKAQILVEMGAG